MQMIDVERPIRKVLLDPFVACRVSRETQEAFDQLAGKNFLGNLDRSKSKSYRSKDNRYMKLFIIDLYLRSLDTYCNLEH